MIDMRGEKTQGSDIEKDSDQPRHEVCPVGYDSCSPCRPFVEGQVLPCGIVINGKPMNFPNHGPDTAAGDNLGKAIVIEGPTPSPKSGQQQESQPWKPEDNHIWPLGTRVQDRKHGELGTIVRYTEKGGRPVAQWDAWSFVVDEKSVKKVDESDPCNKVPPICPNCHCKMEELMGIGGIDIDITWAWQCPVCHAESDRRMKNILTINPKSIPNRCNWCGTKNVEVHEVRDVETDEIDLVCLVCDPAHKDGDSVRSCADCVMSSIAPNGSLECQDDCQGPNEPGSHYQAKV